MSLIHKTFEKMVGIFFVVSVLRIEDKSINFFFKRGRGGDSGILPNCLLIFCTLETVICVHITNNKSVFVLTKYVYLVKIMIRGKRLEVNKKLYYKIFCQPIVYWPFKQNMCKYFGHNNLKIHITY